MLLYALINTLKRSEQLNGRLCSFLLDDIAVYDCRCLARVVVAIENTHHLDVSNPGFDIVSPEESTYASLKSAIDAQYTLNRTLIDLVSDCEVKLAEDYLAGEIIPDVSAKKMYVDFVEHCDVSPETQLPLTDLCDLLNTFYDFDNDTVVRDSKHEIDRLYGARESLKRKWSDDNDDECVYTRSTTPRLSIGDIPGSSSSNGSHGMNDDPPSHQRHPKKQILVPHSDNDDDL